MLPAAPAMLIAAITMSRTFPLAAQAKLPRPKVSAQQSP